MAVKRDHYFCSTKCQTKNAGVRDRMRPLLPFRDDAQSARQTSSCLICCDTDDIPSVIRALVLDVRSNYPFDTIGKFGSLQGTGFDKCWNCRGAGTTMLAQP